jgi:hypothetical protein
MRREHVARQKNAVFSLREILPAGSALIGRTFLKQPSGAPQSSPPLTDEFPYVASTKPLAQDLAVKGQINALAPLEPQLNKPKIMLREPGWREQE